MLPYTKGMKVHYLEFLIDKLRMEKGLKGIPRLFEVFKDFLKKKCFSRFSRICGNPTKSKTRKNKIMVSRVNLQTDSGKYQCSVCRKGAGSYSTYCSECLLWAHEKSNSIIGRLKPDFDYCCSRCKGTARTIDGKPYNDWLFVQDKKLDAANSFCYIGNTIAAEGG